MKVYIAGPMSGYDDYNYPAFNKSAALLRANGFEVFNPAESFGGDTTLPRGAYARVDIQAVLDSEGIVLLDGWDRSRGAVTEMRVAADLGLTIYRLTDPDNPRPVLRVHDVVCRGTELWLADAKEVRLLWQPTARVPPPARDWFRLPDNPQAVLGVGHPTAPADQDGFVSPSPEAADRPTTLEGATLGVKFDTGKPDFTLLDPIVMRDFTICMTKGARKYGRDQWRKGMPMTRALAALHRHLNAFERGEDRDPDSGDHHLTHVLCDAMFALVFLRTHPDMDDRLYASEGSAG